jgi:transcriptional regulator with XRE-family HTH domain
MPRETPFRDTLAGTVRAELARRKIGTREAARMAGLSPSTMSRRLADGRFTIDALANLAAALQIPVADLIPADDAPAEAAAS